MDHSLASPQRHRHHLLQGHPRLLVKNYVHHQLAELCRRYPLVPKIVFVAGKQVGHVLAGALARAGQPWVNLRMRVPSDVARELAGPQMEADGRERLRLDAEHFFVERLVDRCIRQRRSPLALLRPSRQNTETFRSTLASLRSARVRPDALREAGKTELAGLLAAYEAELDERRHFDKPALVERARRLVTEHGSRDETVYAILDETPLSALEAEFVEALVGERPFFRIGRSGYGLRAPRQTAAHYFRDRPLVGVVEEAIHPAGRIRTEGMTAADAERVRLRRCLGVEAEVRGVLRDVLARGLAFDDVEIAYTSASPYVPQLVSLAEELDVPVRFAAGLPAPLTAPGRAVLGYLDWIAGGFDPKALSALLRTGCVAFDELGAAPDVQPHHVARVLDRLPIPRGRSGYEHALGREREALASSSNESIPSLSPPVQGERFSSLAEEVPPLGPEGSSTVDRGGVPKGRRGKQGKASAFQSVSPRTRRELERVEAARTLVRALLEPLPDEEPASLGQLAAALHRFVERFAHRRDDRQRHACQSLAERLQDMQEIDHEAPLGRLAGRVGELLHEHTVEAHVAEPSALYAAPVDRAGYGGRPHLYVLGMDETSFPASASEDPILLDDDRAELSVRLERLRDRPAAQTWQLVRLLGQATGEVTMTAAVTSLADGKERFGSAFFIQAAHQLRPDGQDDVAWEAPWSLTEPQGTFLTDGEWYLAGRRRLPPRHARDAFPALAAGAHALRQREGTTFSGYDGYVGVPVPHLAPGGDEASVFSSSRLETLAACPHRYFLRYVLGVRPPEVQEDDTSRWLDPLQFGELLHEVLYVFMKRITRRGERPTPEHAGEVEAVVRERAETWRAERVRAPSEAAYASDVRRLERAAQLFLSDEARREDVEAVGFEVGFGMGDTPPVEVELDAGRTIRLRGQIDRVDRTPEGYEIWDYKSGGDSTYDDGDLLTGGRRLQWALYAYAFEQMLRRSDHLDQAPVARSGYFFVSDRTHGKRLAQPPPAPEVLAETLRPLFEMVEAGAFLKVYRGRKPCTFCDYRTVCADEMPGKRDARHCLDGCPDDAPFAEPAAAWIG